MTCPKLLLWKWKILNEGEKRFRQLSYIECRKSVLNPNFRSLIVVLKPSLGKRTDSAEHAANESRGITAAATKVTYLNDIARKTLMCRRMKRGFEGKPKSQSYVTRCRAKLWSCGLIRDCKTGVLPQSLEHKHEIIHAGSDTQRRKAVV